MNLPVVPGQVFHPGSQDVLDRAERSITLRETVQRACRKPATAFRQGSKAPHKSQQSAWPRHGSGGPAGAQEHNFRAHGQNTATNPQRRPQPRGGGPQKGSGRGAGRNGGPAYHP